LRVIVHVVIGSVRTVRLNVFNSRAEEEVWKARDTRLDRDIALKVLKPEFTA
jgi:hypothetical protein